TRPVLGVRAVEASSVQPGRPRRRLRRGGHRTQPRRRGGGAVRQHPALERRLPQPPAPRPAGRARLREEGEAAGTPGGAGDGGLLRAHRHRLHRRGVPDGGGQQAPRLQGGAQRHRGRFAGSEGGVLLRVPRQGRPPVRGRDDGRGRGRTAVVQLVRRPDDRRRVRVLQARGASSNPMTEFAAGDRVLLLDRKGRRYMITLAPGGEFHTHAGWVRHDELIGQTEGATVRSTSGAAYLTVRPTLADFVLKMPRGAQVIYPKDLGAILIL